jgi:hypothetical protein
MFLSDEDVKELSGYVNTSCQIRWLSQNGIKFLVRADGKPRVLQSHIEEVMGVAAKTTKRRSEPNFAKLEKRAHAT